MERKQKVFRDLSRSSQVDIANEIYGVMISFKPREVSLQFFFILRAFFANALCGSSGEMYLLQFIDIWIPISPVKAETLSKKRENETTKSAKLNLYTSITQDWATGHVGLQLAAEAKKTFKKSPIESRWCWIGVREINFTLVFFYSSHSENNHD